MFKTRQYLVFFLLTSFILALLVRLFFLQVVGFARFEKLAAEQHNAVFKIEPHRGTIYDRFMEPLAINLDAPSVYADPRSVDEKELTASILSEALDTDHDILLERLQRDKAFVWVRRKVDTQTADKLKGLDLDGVYFIEESKRNYPNDNMASHIIGFAGIDNDGLEGLELTFDDRLKGKPGWRHLIRDAKRQTVLFNEKESLPPQNGYNLVLTIDGVVQYIVEEELKKMVRKFRASSASAIVMDPFTGRILALANYPDYDLNGFAEAPKDMMKNTAISSIFEPGSVFKIVTASAALNEEKFDLDDKFHCENGEYKVGGRILHDYHPYGKITFKEVISKSSNIGTVKIAQDLGEEKVYEYIKKFGFGKKTGIDLRGEVGGISRPPSVWSRSDISTIPIGQGIAVTSVQLARAISVIANGGFLVKPYVVERITTPEGQTFKEFEPEFEGRILRKETCEDMKEVLRSVVTDGTGRRAKSKLYTTCGKTGTAQMVNPNGGYYENKYHATFIGFAPQEKPAISVVVTAGDPHPIHFGGSVAGPTFRRITERTLQYLNSNKPALSRSDKYGRL